MTAHKLALSALPNMHASVGVPAYDPRLVDPGIVHLGLGCFHRAHMARYTHMLMNQDRKSLKWGIVGAGLMPNAAKVIRALAAQDCLYTLVERDDRTETLQVIGCVKDVIHTTEGSSPLLDAITRAGTRIVSLTVTEHGYCLSPATKRLDMNHPAIAADIEDPTRPQSAIGIIVEAYRRRMVGGGKPFTAMSCDNIQHNGAVLRRAVLDLAEVQDEALASWIDCNGFFPSTMVDRITPATSPDDVADLAKRYAIADAAPVFSETFSQWVIEDNFADGRPDWDQVGAHFVPDVAPYEFMKLRLLNASHLAIAGPGRLLGYTYIHETLNDPMVRSYMVALMDRETGPTLLPVPGVDITAYKAQLIERFANPRIRDTVDRVNADASLNYLLDPIRDRLARRQSIDLLALAVAAWIRRVRGEDEGANPIAVRHPLASLLRDRACQGGADPMPVLKIASLFGDLANEAVFVAAVEKWLASLYAVGTRETLLTIR